jgi:hypothetical protein
MGERMLRTNTIAQMLLGGWLLVTTSLSVAGEENMNPDKDAIAERFISAFYSWDALSLKSLMTDDADAAAILYYQAWAEAANYKVKTRRPCKDEAEEVICAITVTDDFGSAMGYEATDTFRLTVAGNKISAVTFSGDDPPVFQELFQWISEKQPDILSGPCLNMFAGGETPGDCARAVAEAARAFMDERRKTAS